MAIRLRGIRAGPRQRRTQAAEPVDDAVAASHIAIGHRSLSYGGLVLWQFWILVRPHETLDDPLLAGLADGVLKAMLKLAPELAALCVVFYTDLDLEACLGCYEWAPGGEWNRAGSGAPRSWRRLPFQKFDPNN